MYYNAEHELAFLYALTNLGYKDVATAVKWLDEAGVAYTDFAGWLGNEIGAPPCSDPVLDVCAWALEYICIRAGVPELAHRIQDNYASTYIDGTEEGLEVLAQVPENERGKAWEFLKKFLEGWQ